MKQIITKLRKSLYLIIGISLLFSNIPTFAQEADFLAPLSMGDITPYSHNFIEQIDDLYWQFNNNFGIYDKGRRWIKNYPTWYKQLTAEEDRILFHTQALNMPDVANKNAMEIIAYTKYMYNGTSESLNTLRLQDQIILKKLEELIEFTINEEYLHPELPYSELIGIERTNQFKYCIVYFKKRFKYENFYIPLRELAISYNSTIYVTKMVPFFRNSVDPIDILQYAYSEMLPKEKAGVELLIAAKDSDILKHELVTKIRKYLIDFGKGITDVKLYTLQNIAKELKGMNIAERTKYVEEITNLQPGSQKFIQDVERLKRPARRYIRKNILKDWGPLAIIGAIMTTAYITDVIVENHHNRATVSQRDLAEIGKKIEKGLASNQEKWIFFTNPVSQKFVETDPIYTLNFAKLALDIYHTENFLKEIKIKEAKRQKELEDKILDNYKKTSNRFSKDPKLGIF